MDKKTALLTLLENSFWISDTDKRNILLKIDTLTDAQIDQLGKFLAEERDVMIQDKDKILNNSNSLLKIVRESLKQLQ